MAVVLGHNQYGKAENRVVRVFRDGDPHELVDYNVSVALSGGQEAAHLTGDNASTLPTDTQKNTVYAFANEDDAVAQPELFGIRWPGISLRPPSRSPGPGSAGDVPWSRRTTCTPRRDGRMSAPPP